MQDLNDMVLFAEVAEHGGFAAAGRALGVPKSRLSRRVADLEVRLGVQLLQRSTRSLSLTPAGTIYLRHCAAMRDAAQAAAEAVAQIQTEPRGTVRISCPVTLAHSSVGPLLPTFLKRFPLVRIDMWVLNRPVDPIEEGVDIALRVRAVIEDSATLAARRFGESRTLLVASPELLRRHPAPRTVDDLTQLDTLAMGSSDGTTSWQLFGPDGAAHRHDHAPRYVADDLLSLRFAVLQGIGASILPDYMCRNDLKAGRLVEVLPGWRPAASITHAMYPPRRALVPAVRQLIEFLAENLNADEPHDFVI
ncbi:LysR family transcriptional regulator [Variovorax sp. J22G21]|uniref:LysR family transcriptional regulator n=1 Tax=Variovorax fucosicus TaxID=3053517 RepID=UPI0025768C76|nr:MULTISPECIES: LysR family transcriptional regulator [unclassified Variovorax]MDM0041383.1 LysR family transcriptional regulator [Variovorax sp. J22R193]MDM0057747.1 LysR family transcriptional regulator [Variovorax sp. J22G47]MDM0060439.1 LysR family transcriptional regulator [Variovorax sp. J22G21]